jgi:hypothetical protein
MNIVFNALALLDGRVGTSRSLVGLAPAPRIRKVSKQQADELCSRLYQTPKDRLDSMVERYEKKRGSESPTEGLDYQKRPSLAVSGDDDDVLFLQFFDENGKLTRTEEGEGSDGEEIEQYQLPKSVEPKKQSESSPSHRGPPSRPQSAQMSRRKATALDPMWSAVLQDPPSDDDDGGMQSRTPYRPSTSLGLSRAQSVGPPSTLVLT